MPFYEILLLVLIVVTALILKFRKKLKGASIFALAAFYSFLIAGIPWYHVRSAGKWSDVNHWYFLAAVIFAIFHFIFKRNSRKFYFWLAIISLVGGAIFLIIRLIFGQHFYPYFFPI